MDTGSRVENAQNKIDSQRLPLLHSARHGNTSIRLKIASASGRAVSIER
jgi:hypothetical protein